MQNRDKPNKLTLPPPNKRSRSTHNPDQRVRVHGTAFDGSSSMYVVQHHYYGQAGYHVVSAQYLAVHMECKASANALGSRHP